MAPNDDMTVGSVRGRQIYKVDPVAYEQVSRAHQNLLDPDDKSLAIQGLKWMATDGLAEGFNPFTFYADLTQPGNGSLGTNDKYITNPETGELEPPIRTWVGMA